MRLWISAVIVALVAGCGDSPTKPSHTPAPAPSPAPAPIPSPVTVTDTVTGAPVAGATRTVAGTRATVSADGYVTRELAASAATIDLIPLAGFDLGFYRQLVRGAFDRPLEPLRRVSVSPRIYIRTVEQSGAPVDSAVVNSVERIVRSSAIIEAFTGGRFGLAGIEAGTGTREGVAGWITIRWQAGDPNVIGCGHAAIAGGWIELTNHPICGCQGFPNAFPRGVKHEIGHALGFWHTDDPNDLMHGTVARDCDNNPSPRERHHAALAYARLPGNLDVDRDPLTPSKAAGLTIID